MKDVCYISTLDEHFDPAAFPNFPEKPGQIEESRLEEEGEADPLVVLVVPWHRIGPGRCHYFTSSTLLLYNKDAPGNFEQAIRRVIFITT